MTKSDQPTRLLVVHPDGEVRTFLRRRFSSRGYEVSEAGGHDKAISLIAAGPFDLALVDLTTPGADGQDGLELLRRMREARSAEELPIMAIAEHAAGEDAAEALALGADDCLFPPVHVDLAQARAEMLIGPPRQPRPKRGGELQARLESLEEAAVRTEALSANLVALGVDGIIPINGLLGAASALTAICRTPGLKPAIERIETAAAALDMVMVRALGRADRRSRAPKTRLKVLVAVQDAFDGRAIRDLLKAAEVEVELIEADGGSKAVLATDSMFFDLIVLRLAGTEEIAGIQAIRRAERQNRTRRTPILAVGAEGQVSTESLDAGADLFIRAPVTAERLLAALADALARHSEDVRAVA